MSIDTSEVFRKKRDNDGDDDDNNNNKDDLITRNEKEMTERIAIGN